MSQKSLFSYNFFEVHVFFLLKKNKGNSENKKFDVIPVNNVESFVTAI